MSEFDDPDLGRRLRSAAGDDPDVAAAHGAVHRQVGRVRRRRAAALSGGAVALLVGVGMVAAWGPDDSPAQIGTTSPGPGVDTTGTGVTDSSALVATSSSVAGSVATSGSVDTTVTTTPSPPDPSAPSTPSVPPTSPGSPAVTTTPTASTSAPTAPPTTQSFSCIGGAITVRLQGGQLQLVSTAPASGFVVDEQNVQATEVEVRFQSTTHRSKVSVHLVGGAMQQEPCEEREESESEAGGDEAGSSTTYDDD